METFGRIVKNKYFQALIAIILTLALLLVALTLMRLALGVEYPLLVVSSGSMTPTLNVGDIIVIKGVSPSQVNVGDIVVFRNPWKKDVLIVHRVVDISFERDRYLITTLGDAVSGIFNRDQFSPWDASLLVGKVIAKVPCLGSIYLLVRQEGGSISPLFTLLLILLIILVLTLPSPSEIEGKKGKVIARVAYITAVNALLIGFLALSLWGNIEIPRLGESVKILGMYEELRMNEIKYGRENILLNINFMTYKIDCQLNNSVRPGVLTFSWFQFLLLILILFNVQELFGSRIHKCLKKIFSRRKTG